MRTAEAAEPVAPPQPPSMSEALTEEVERLYGSIRFDDLCDKIMLRASADGSRTEETPTTTSFHLKLITQFLVVKEAQDWVNAEVAAEEKKWGQELEAELKKGEQDLENEFHHPSAKDEKPPLPSSSRISKTSAHTDSERRDPWNLSSDTRVNYRNGLDVYAHGRARRDLKTEEWVNSFFLDAGWSTEDLWVADLEIQSNHAFSPVLLLTWTSSFHRSLENGFTTSHHGPSLARTLGSNQAIGLGATANTRQDRESWTIGSYSLSGSYRWAHWHDHFFFTASPSIVFDGEQNYRRDMGLTLSLEALL